jgi:TusA-related sulfurtransferase
LIEFSLASGETGMARTTYPTPHVTLDMTGAACPGPMLGAKRVLDELLPGEVMLLVSDCAATGDDLVSWPKYADVEILKTRNMPHGATGYYIRRGKGRRVLPNAVLDMRGTTCPGPIVEAKKLLNGMRKGEVLQLTSDCPGIRADVRSWVKATGLALADAREVAPGEYQFYICKR